MRVASSLWLSIPAMTAAVAAIGFACLLLYKDRSSAFNRGLATVLGAAALIQVGNGLVLIDMEHALFWGRVALVAECLQPAALLFLGLVLTEPERPVIVSAARWRARAVTLLAAVWGILAWSDLVYTSINSDGSLIWIGMGSLGRVAYTFILLSLVLGLSQLEQILRATRDPLRYQLKFVLIGLGALGGVSIYQTTRLLLIPAWQSDYVLVGGTATLIAVGLVAYGLGRSRLGEMRAKVFVSPQVLYGSITFLVVGLYLLGVGVIGEMIRYAGLPSSVALSTLLVFIAAVGLAVVLLSRQARAELRRFVARHFYRSKYDYRAKWLEVTEAFRMATSEDTILDQLLDVLSRTFGAERISIWMRYEADGRFHQVRSVNTQPAPPALDMTHPVVARLTTADDPLTIEDSSQDRPDVDPVVDPFGEATRAVLCAPIRSGERLIAFATLSVELHAEPYGTDDSDLLRAIAHHAAALFSHAQLAEERRAAVQLEALHRFSAFCLHDLKNLTARLSLVAQNAAVYGQDPAFQQSAMQTVAGTVQKMMALMAKLSSPAESAREVDQDQVELTDVRAVLAETVESLNGGLQVAVRRTEESVPPVRMKPEQLQQVLLNVILNARQACGEQGEIRISTGRVQDSAVITVSDTGPGIPPSALRTLFQPFQSTKEGGLGVGLYECKQIVESHRGTVFVESVVGQGTCVQITLPLASRDSHGS